MKDSGEIMFKRQLVLVAIDQATDVKRMMDVAVGTAKARGADVHVVRVVPQTAVHRDDGIGLWMLEPHGDRDAAIKAQLASIARSAEDGGVRVRSVTLRGTPEQVVPAYAQLHEAAMLVVERTYGRSLFSRSGRMVDALTRRSPMPVLVLPRRQTREREGEGLRRVLAPIDFSTASAVALRTAVDLSRRHGARVTLLHALQDWPQHRVFTGSEAWKLIQRLPAQRQAVAERLRRKGAFFGAVDVDTEVTTGVAAGAILEIAGRSEADLIVMGIAQRSWLDRLLSGSTLRRVLRRATVPVLVVPVVAGAHAWPSEVAVDQISSRGGTESVADRVAA
jgi:nucleotide-binding universal stress UspA family protein